MSGQEREADATWALTNPSVWESPDARSIPTLLAAIGQVLAHGDAAIRDEAKAEALAPIRALVAPARGPDGEPLPEWVHVDEIRALLDGGDQ